MKKIMFALIAIAILFASCGNPVMPVDNTDDRLVGTWTWTDGAETYVWHFENDGTGYYGEGSAIVNIEWNCEWNGNVGTIYYDIGANSENINYEIIDITHIKIIETVFDKVI